MTKDIFGTKVKYKFVTLPPDVDGEYHPIKKEIFISNKINGTVLEETVLHETLHAIINILGFDQILDDGVEELLVSNLSYWINLNYKVVRRVQ